MKTFWILAILCAVHYSHGSEDAAQLKNLDPVAADSSDLMDSSKIAKRESEPICGCTKEYRPSCGANGHIYSNPCRRECAGVDPAPMSVCRRTGPTPYRRSGGGQSACEHSCPWTYDPVCGRDGKIYNNYCLLHCAVAGIAPMEYCEQKNECMCPTIYNPVFGQRCVEYGNICLLECAGDTQMEDFECRPD